MSAPDSGTEELPALASNAGRIPLSIAKLRLLHPEGPTSGMADEEVRDHLERGDARAAIVVSTEPPIVAAYSDEFDAVVLLELDSEVFQRLELQAEQRLLAVNAYSPGAMSTDIRKGPQATNNFANFHPIIAEFVSDDADAIMRCKTNIAEQEWARTKALAATTKTRTRDGRPYFAWQERSVAVIYSESDEDPASAPIYAVILAIASVLGGLADWWLDSTVALFVVTLGSLTVLTLGYHFLSGMIVELMSARRRRRKAPTTGSARSGLNRVVFAGGGLLAVVGAFGARACDDAFRVVARGGDDVARYGGTGIADDAARLGLVGAAKSGDDVGRSGLRVFHPHKLVTYAADGAQIAIQLDASELEPVKAGHVPAAIAVLLPRNDVEFARMYWRAAGEGEVASLTALVDPDSTIVPSPGALYGMLKATVAAGGQNVVIVATTTPEGIIFADGARMPFEVLERGLPSSLNATVVTVGSVEANGSAPGAVEVALSKAKKYR